MEVVDIEQDGHILHVIEELFAVEKGSPLGERKEGGDLFIRGHGLIVVERVGQLFSAVIPDTLVDVPVLLPPAGRALDQIQ